MAGGIDTDRKAPETPDGARAPEVSCRDVVTGNAASGAKTEASGAAHASGLRGVRVLAACSLVLLLGSGAYFALGHGGIGAGGPSPEFRGSTEVTEEDADGVEASDASLDETTQAEGDAGAAKDASDKQASSSSVGGGSNASGGPDANAGSAATDPVAPEHSGGGNAGSQGQDTAPSAPKGVTVSVSIDSSAADGSVSSSGTFTLEQGASAYDALCALGVSVSSSQSMYGVYVTAIGGLAEKDGRYGASSGWMYAVNGARPNVSCSAYALKDGDRITWTYVTG